MRRRAQRSEQKWGTLLRSIRSEVPYEHWNDVFGLFETCEVDRSDSRVTCVIRKGEESETAWFRRVPIHKQAGAFFASAPSDLQIGGYAGSVRVEDSTELVRSLARSANAISSAWVCDRQILDVWLSPEGQGALATGSAVALAQDLRTTLLNAQWLFHHPRACAALQRAELAMASANEALRTLHWLHQTYRAWVETPPPIQTMPSIPRAPRLARGAAAEMLRDVGDSITAWANEQVKVEALVGIHLAVASRLGQLVDAQIEAPCTWLRHSDCTGRLAALQADQFLSSDGEVFDWRHPVIDVWRGWRPKLVSLSAAQLSPPEEDSFCLS